MSRLSFRPRPLDIHKKLPVLRSFKDFEDDETPTSTRNSQLLRISAVDSGHEIEVHPPLTKKLAPEIPTPQFVIVDTYERDYSRTFGQPNSYLRARGAQAELGEFVEYDLDNEDEDRLEEFNSEEEIIAPEKLESLIFKLEVLDHKARERAGVIIPTLASPIPVLLQLDVATEALHGQSLRYNVVRSVYEYWKDKVHMTYEDKTVVPTGTGIGRKLLDRLYQTYSLELGGTKFAYDGEKSLYTVGPLPQQKLDFTVVLEESFSSETESPGRTEKRLKQSIQSKTINVEITYTAKIPMKPVALPFKDADAEIAQDAHRVLDIVLRHRAVKR